MLPDSPSTPQKLQQPAKDSPDESIGYSRLARRIVRRTSDLLAISIVAVALISIGGQLSDWWSTDSDEVASATRLNNPLSATDPRWGSGQTPVAMQFGELPQVLERTVVRGTHDKASRALIANCQQVVQSQPIPSSPIEESERNLLDRVQLLKPLYEGRGTWAIYRISAPLTMVVGTRHFSVLPSSKSSRSGPEEKHRVVCWGIAIPQDEDRWTLLTMATAGLQASTSGIQQFELPQGCRRLLSLQGKDGSAIIGLEGEGLASEWLKFFGRQFDSRGWQTLESTQTAQNGWRAHYRIPGETSEGQVAIQIHTTESSGLIGLIMLTAPLPTTNDRGRP